MHPPGVEPGARPWEDPMLPLHHECMQKQPYHLYYREIGPDLAQLRHRGASAQLAGRVHSDTFVEENMSASGAAPDSRQPATLTIAGTDPSGGAGIQVRWPRKINLSIRWCAESFENG